MKLVKQTIAVLVVLLLLIACLPAIVSASTVQSSSATNCNVWGFNGQTVGGSGITVLNVTTNADEYISIINVDTIPSDYNLIDRVTEITYDQIGASVSLSDSNIVVNNPTFTYGEGGTASGDERHVVYSTIGNKTISVSNIGWNGDSVITSIGTKQIIVYGLYPEIIKDTTISDSFDDIGNKTEYSGLQGDIIYLNVEVKELPTLTYTYQWYDNGVLIPNLVTNHVAVATKRSESSSIVEHKYHAVISNSINSITSRDATFYAYPITPPEIKTLSGVVSPTESLVGNVTLNADIDTHYNDGIRYTWQMKLDSSSQWTELKSGTFDRNVTQLSYVYPFKLEKFSVVSLRLALAKPDRFAETFYSEEFQFTAYRNPYNMTVETSAGFTYTNYKISSSFEGFDSSSVYSFEYSSDGGATWNTVAESTGTLSGYAPEQITKNVVFYEEGVYLIRAVVVYQGVRYYSEIVSMNLIDSPRVRISVMPENGILSSGTPVLFTVTSSVSGFDEIVSYEWQYSTDDETWNTISGQTTDTLSEFSYTFYDVGGIYFKLIVTDGEHREIESNVDGYVSYTNPIVKSSELGASSADEYIIPVKTVFPFKVIETYAISSTYGLVITSHAAYVIDATYTNWEEKDVISTLYFGQGIVSLCKYLNGHLIAKTLNGDVFVVNVLTSSFGDSMDLLGFSKANSIDLSQFKFMVADNGVGIYVYNLDGTTDCFVADIYNNVFGITKHASDGSQSFRILAGNTNSNVITAYKSDGTYSTVTLNGKLQSVTGLNDQTDKIIAITDSSTVFVSYSLRTVSFEFGNVDYGNMILKSPYSSNSGSIISGGSDSSFVIMKSNGNIETNFPTASTVIQTRLARSSENIAISGGNNGQVYIIAKSSNGWSGLQSFSVGSMVKSLGMSEEGFIVLAANEYEVYSGIHAKDESQGEVVTTLYYLTVTVYDENGKLMPNAQFRVTSDKGSIVYSTDSYGARTVQVSPTYDYIFALPNGEDSVTLNANNYALQYISLQYPKKNILEGVTYNAKLTENRYINLKFNDKNNNLFDLIIEIKDENKNSVYSYEDVTTNYEHVFDTTSVSGRYFYVSMNGFCNGKRFKESWIFEIQRYDDGSGGTTTDPKIGNGVILGEIPVIPSVLGENWTTFLFGGLIMIIGGLFGYAHSAKGCVLVVIIAAVLTFVFHALPINPIWMGCMVILGFLAIYSWASQNEGN